MADNLYTSKVQLSSDISKIVQSAYTIQSKVLGATSQVASNSISAQVNSAIATAQSGISTNISTIINQIVQSQNAAQLAHNTVQRAIADKFAQAQLQANVNTATIADRLRANFERQIADSSKKFTALQETTDDKFRQFGERITRKGDEDRDALLRSILQHSNTLRNAMDKFADRVEKPKPSFDREGVNDWLGDELTQELIKTALEQIFHIDLDADIAGFFQYFIDRIKDVISILDDINSGREFDIDTVKERLFGHEESSEFATAIWAVINFLPMLKSLMDVSFANYYARVNEIALSESVPQKFDITLAARALNMGLLNAEQFFEELQKQGWSEERVRKIYEMIQVTPDLNQQYEMFRRGLIDETQLKYGLLVLGFHSSWENALKDMAFFQPTPQDVVRFVVRDVYDEELAALGNIFQGWDNPEYLAEARKAGIKEEHARLYWGAHWQVPSPTQGYEMLHRGLINEAQLDALLKSADYAPAWRPKLAAISYNNPTRVDTRRMFEMGVIDENEVFTILKGQGYNDRHARFLLDFFKRLKAKSNAPKSNQVKLSVSVILRAYKKGILARNEAVTRLTNLGYMLSDIGVLLADVDTQLEDDTSEDYTKEIRARFKAIAEEGYINRTLSHSSALEYLKDAGLSKSESEAILALCDIEYSTRRKQEILKLTRDRFLDYELDEASLSAIMARQNFTNQEINKHIKELEPFRQFRHKDLTRADVKKAYQANAITLEDVIQQLKSMQYSDKDIEIIMVIDGYKEMLQ